MWDISNRVVISQLYYANCLYIDQAECDLKKQQRIQNIAAKIVLKKERKLNHLPEETTLATNCNENKIQSFYLGL